MPNQTVSQLINMLQANFNPEDVIHAPVEFVSTSVTLADGSRLSIRSYSDGNVFVLHADTGLNVGIGRLDNADGQPFVSILTEDATDDPVNDEPMLSITLNDADIYDVDPDGPTPDSHYHNPR